MHRERLRSLLLLLIDCLFRLLRPALRVLLQLALCPALRLFGRLREHRVRPHRVYRQTLIVLPAQRLPRGLVLRSERKLNLAHFHLAVLQPHIVLDIRRLRNLLRLLRKLPVGLAVGSRLLGLLVLLYAQGQMLLALLQQFVGVRQVIGR